MSKSLKLKNDKYIDSSGITHNRDKLSDILNSLPRTYQSKILQNSNAWPGTTNKVTIPITYYGYYLVISATPYGNCSIYLITVINSSVNKIKISGTIDSDFSINGKELSINFSSSSYLTSFILFLGNVN